MVLCLIFKTTQSPSELNVRNPVELKFRDGTGKARTGLLSENNCGNYEEKSGFCVDHSPQLLFP